MFETNLTCRKIGVLSLLLETKCESLVLKETEEDEGLN